MKEFEIRRLIENYYDIQKIRVETFNRIVAWVKENRERIEKVLSQNKTESHSVGVSQQLSENHSHKVFETQGIHASQKLSESQEEFASLYKSESQKLCASQYLNETQAVVASHNKAESQKLCASYRSNETQEKIALELLKKKKYSEFVKKFVLSQVSSESHGFIASHLKNGTHERAATLSNLIKEIDDLIWFHNRLYETEKGLYQRIDEWSKDHPLRKKFLNHVKGIGPILSSGIVAWLCNPILKADYVSQIWSYCGLAPGQERKKGKKVNYNPRLKSFCWKIGQSFIKFKCFGRKLYESFRRECEEKHPDWSKLHQHNWARRKVVKLFLAAVWETWRKMNDLPVTKPYPIKILGHKDIITPEMWMEKLDGPGGI